VQDDPKRRSYWFPIAPLIRLSSVGSGTDRSFAHGLFEVERIADIAGDSVLGEIFAVAFLDAISGQPDMRKMWRNRTVDPLPTCGFQDCCFANRVLNPISRAPRFERSE